MKIESLDRPSKLARVALTQDELLIISNALNEICNGVHIDDPEFQTRMGVERSEARQILRGLHAVSQALAGEGKAVPSEGGYIDYLE